MILLFQNNTFIEEAMYIYASLVIATFVPVLIFQIYENSKYKIILSILFGVTIILTYYTTSILLYVSSIFILIEVILDIIYKNKTKEFDFTKINYYLFSFIFLVPSIGTSLYLLPIYYAVIYMIILILIANSIFDINKMMTLQKMTSRQRLLKIIMLDISIILFIITLYYEDVYILLSLSTGLSAFIILAITLTSISKYHQVYLLREKEKEIYNIPK